jgi:ligand-binding sensor domain-containing protein
VKIFLTAFHAFPRFGAVLATIVFQYVSVGNLYPQTNPLRFGRLGLEHGLSQNTVNCLHQDRIGFLWIGTNDGLNLYDGYSFKIYRVDRMIPVVSTITW